MTYECVVSGIVIYGDEFEATEGYVVIREGIIHEVGTGEVDSSIQGLVAPLFINAHTHVGDSIAKEVSFDSLGELVKPKGLKYKLLSEVSEGGLIASMRSCLCDMKRTGTCTFVDFREGGVSGVRALRRACIEGLKPIILGRPNGDDVKDVLTVADGIGMSSVNDHPWDVLQEVSEATKKSGKLFAIHAGEVDRSDVEGALELMPDFLVHMTHADKDDLKAAVDKNIPIVVCPRSNFVTGVGRSGERPPIKEMIELGVTVALGTDNVMLNPVNMFAEMEFAVKTFWQNDRQVFKMATLNGAKMLHLDEKMGSIREGKAAHIMILDEKSNNLCGTKDFVKSIVRRARPDDIKVVLVGKSD
ncbi:MAG: amidohydrolase family protein [Methanocellales archaeon]|nr:amidohydrolase family protein [Methanocellales archaeon]